MLEEVVALLEEGKTLWGARAAFAEGKSSRVKYATTHYLVKPGARPDTSLSLSENEALGLIKRVMPLFNMNYAVRKTKRPWHQSGYSYYIAAEPFHVWAQYRGEAGNKKARDDWFVRAVPIRTVEELADFLRQEEETERVQLVKGAF